MHLFCNQYLISQISHNFKESEICTKTYEGGCKNIEEKKLSNRLSARNYTVGECHHLCTAEPECGGFFLSKETKNCMLVRDGCINNNNVVEWDYYDMADCITNSKLL